MFSRVLALLAVLLLSANTWAAIEINNHQARNMDDVQSLGVIYINHNSVSYTHLTLPTNSLV